MMKPFFFLTILMLSSLISHSQVKYFVGDSATIFDRPSIEKGEIKRKEKITIHDSTRISVKDSSILFYKIVTSRNDTGWVKSEFLVPEIFKKPNQLEFGSESEPEWVHFYPVGWSRDGKFAYYNESTESYACGDGSPTNFFVFDTKLDSEIFSLYEGCPSSKGFWEDEYQVLQSKLNSFNIISKSSFEISKSGGFKIRKKDDGYELIYNGAFVKKVKRAFDRDFPEKITHLGYLVSPQGNKYLHLLLVSTDTDNFIHMEATKKY